MNKDNLLVLANYLATLPDDYPAFEMEIYFETREARALRKAPAHNNLLIEEQRAKDRPTERQYALHNGGVNTCGAVACAIGHGPAAGFLAQLGDISVHTSHVDWDVYQDRVFGLEDERWSWCFGGDWANFDNTPAGAAKRIRYLLAHGEPPENYFEPGENYVEMYQGY